MTDIAPYYRSADGAIVVYHARVENVLAAGLVPVEEVALIHADPPYGVNERTKRRSAGRGLEAGSSTRGRNVNGRGRPKIRDFAPVAGDDQPYDPSPILELRRPTVLWGGNHYASRLPGSPSWFSWDKRSTSPPGAVSSCGCRESAELTSCTDSDDNADGELAWTNLGGPLRIFRHLWRGTCRASEVGPAPHLGPTQKPVALSTWVFQRAKLKHGDLVFVPYLGTGPDLPAALALGLRVIACDLDETWCRVAVSRLKAAPRPEPAAALGPLFASCGGA